MKWLLAMLAMIVMMGAALFVIGREPGYVLITYDVFSLETSLVFFSVALFVTLLILFFLLRFVVNVFFWPIKAANMQRQLRHSKAHQALNQGLIDLAEGRWKRAERVLLRRVSNSEKPLLNYLAAARAAQMQQAYERRDQYLKQAMEADQSADIAVGLSQAELQLSQEQNEQALTTLRRIDNIAPNHEYIQHLLARLYHQVKDWSGLISLLPKLRRATTIKGEKLQRYEQDAIIGALKEMTHNDDLDGIKKLWSHLSRQQRRQDLIVSQYTQSLAKLGKELQAAHKIEKFLQHWWSEILVLDYVRMKHKNVLAAIEKAEHWLQIHGRKAVTLLALGHLCAHAQLWGKARMYLETSIELEAQPETYRVLGDLLKTHMHDEVRARECYEKGLQLAIKGKTGTPLLEQSPASQREQHQTALENSSPAST